MHHRARPRAGLAIAFAVAAGVGSGGFSPVGGASALANIRAPILEPSPPSSAPHLRGGPGDQLTVVHEALTFRCSDQACDVEARYRIAASAPLTADLAFVSPQAAPLTVRVGTAAATVQVGPAPPEPVDDPAIREETRALRQHNLTAFEAHFTAAFTTGENVIVVTYPQPLGREEHGHSYFHKGRFVQLFRYELWPLAEWKRAPGFRIDGQVTIHRPQPSWLKRLFSTPRSLGCEGSELLRNLSLQQRGDELHLTFQVTDPIPRRLWCVIGDEDLVPRPPS